MDYIIQPENKEDLTGMLEMLKSENISKEKKLIMIGYARCMADQIMIQKLQPTGT